MALATAADAMTFLDGTKVTVTDADDTAEQADAERLIRGYLAGKVDPATMSVWDISVPTTVPVIIREVAGRLVAALRYRKVYSQARPEVSAYAMQLWNEAMAIIASIRSGDITLYDLAGNAITDTEHLSRRHYYPNNDTIDTVPVLVNPDASANGYKFGMGMIF